MHFQLLHKSNVQTTHSYKMVTAAELRLSELSNLILPSINYPSSTFHLMILRNFSKRVTLNHCGNVWENFRILLEHPVYVENFQIWLISAGLISWIWLQSLILFFRVIWLFRCPGNFNYKAKQAVSATCSVLKSNIAFWNITFYCSSKNCFISDLHYFTVISWQGFP